MCEDWEVVLEVENELSPEREVEMDLVRKGRKGGPGNKAGAATWGPEQGRCL